MNKIFDKSVKLRNLRESVVGIDKIKDDPFANDRIELEEYEAVIRAMRNSTEGFSRALHALLGQHAEMMGSLKRFHELNENLPQRKRIDAIDAAFDSIEDSIMEQSDQFEAVQRKLDALLAMHSGLALRLKERDKAHQSKSHYEAKIAELQGKDSSDKEKVERNLKKQREAMDEFEKTEQLTISECRDALNTKYKDTDQIVGIYTKTLASIFAGDKMRAVLPLATDMMTSVTRNQVATDKPDESGQVESTSVKEDEAAFPVPSRTQVEVSKAVVAPLVSHAEADHEHNELREALGLRIRGRVAAAPVAAREQSEDTESDLFTPPLK